MPNLYNVIDDIHQQMFQNNPGIRFDVKRRNSEHWIVYVHLPYAEESAKLEFLISNEDSDDIDVTGSVLRYGSVSRRLISRIMDSVLERF